MRARILSSNRLTSSLLCVIAIAAAFAVEHAGAARADDDRGHERRAMTFEDGTGTVRTFSTNGGIDFRNAFFQDLGTNGRRCVTCHQPGSAWTITPEDVQARFAATRGRDPIFRSNDGSDCEGIDTRKGSRAAAYTMLLSKGLIRVGMDVPASAEFSVLSVDDPHACGAPLQSVSMYRRPLPSTNLRFLSAVMWDGRESSPTTTVLEDLARQANDATRGHAQAAADLTDAQRREIVGFETGLFTAQVRDDKAGGLTTRDGGGPVDLAREPFFIGINDPVGLNPSNAAFDPRVFTIFDTWASTPAFSHERAAARSAITRGQEIFNTRPITITGVAGLNDELFASGVRVPTSLTGTCTVCHDTPKAGSHSVKAPLNIGLTDPARRTPDMPLYTLVNRATGETVQTTDPGRAMITGKWRDIGKFKGPVLRALAARAPYFHNGSAATLDEVVEFYNARFDMRLTPQEKADLVAFLRAL
jgi:cytochrome c peroxidase